MQRLDLRAGVVQWQPGDGIASVVSRTLADLGCTVLTVPYNAAIPANLHVVFAAGPSGTLAPLGKQLPTFPVNERPLLVLWQLEQLPNPDLPEWLWYSAGLLRSKIERLAYTQRGTGPWQVRPLLSWATRKAARFRYYGDLHWLHRQQILSVLAISSRWTADLLQRRGFRPLIMPFGLYPTSEWGDNLTLDRDVSLLWLGKMGSNRRGRLVRHIRQELRARGVETLVIDGVERPPVWGQERTKLLNRTKIMLNLVRAKWDDNSIRYILAAANRAMIITEPTLPHSPFVSGVHLVEVPTERIPETIEYYLNHDDERKAITDAAYELVTTKLAMSQVMSPVLERIVSLIPGRSPGTIPFK